MTLKVRVGWGKSGEFGGETRQKLCKVNSENRPEKEATTTDTNEIKKS